jgi:hypothetical protein
VCNSSVLKLEVYAWRKLRSDDYIGETEDQIEALLVQKSDAHPQSLLSLGIDFSWTDVVRMLSKRGSNSAARDLLCVAKFTIVSTQDSVGATEHQMDDAVEQGKKAIAQMVSTTLQPEPLDVVIDTANSSTAQLHAMSKTLVSLLGKIEQFTKIVDGIAQV